LGEHDGDGLGISHRMDWGSMSAAAVVTRPADQSTDDLDLIAAIRAGDDRAFELLFARYQSRMAAYVRGMVRDHGRAEDITQEVFIAALRRIRETEREIAFKPWIYEIAKNACIDAFRRGRHTSEVSFDADDALARADRRRLVATAPAPDVVVDAKLAIDNLCGAFGGLSQTHHEILVMREFEGLTYREIGERLGLSRAAVESTLFRARRRLGEEYEELVSGARCVLVRGIVDAPAGHAVGLRDRRRMARHISHCQPCRRYAHAAGVDLGAARLRMPVAARIAAVLPLPALARRRVEVDEPRQLLAHHSVPSLTWTTKAVAMLDPATVSGWSKAIATAATVAVAGVGAGAAVGHHQTFTRIAPAAPAMVGATHHPEALSERAALSQARSAARAAAHRRNLDPATAAAGTPGAGGADHAAAPAIGVGQTDPDETAPATNPATPVADAPASGSEHPLPGDTPSDPAGPPKTAPIVAPGAPRDPAGGVLGGAGSDAPGETPSSTPLRDLVSGVGAALSGQTAGGPSGSAGSAGFAGAGGGASGQPGAGRLGGASAHSATSTAPAGSVSGHAGAATVGVAGGHPGAGGASMGDGPAAVAAPGSTVPPAAAGPVSAIAAATLASASASLR
jgi:RNA polymerase sigma factor (sigma-70 family)